MPHMILIDEVQDLEPAVLLLLSLICLNQVIFCGDTAQTIMKGLCFRFSDLKKLFHYYQEDVENLKRMLRQRNKEEREKRNFEKKKNKIKEKKQKKGKNNCEDEFKEIDVEGYFNIEKNPVVIQIEENDLDINFYHNNILLDQIDSIVLSVRI